MKSFAAFRSGTYQRFKLIDSAYRSQMARYAAVVSRLFDLLVAATDEGGVRCLAGSLAEVLSMLCQRRLLDREESFLDATFITAKKWTRRSVKHVVGKVRSRWWWSTVGAYLSECNLRPRRLPSVGSPRARFNK
jgi:hypothetical protein